MVRGEREREEQVTTESAAKNTEGKETESLKMFRPIRTFLARLKCAHVSIQVARENESKGASGAYSRAMAKHFALKAFGINTPRPKG
jgi:hypothetical protein